MSGGRSEDVRSLYERYPFPRGTAESPPDFMYASVWLPQFSPAQLAGKRVLEAGCGTGNKLAALARFYPEAEFTGIDLSSSSLAIAREVIDRAKLGNVKLVQGNLLELDRPGEFDVVSSTGVVHHLEDPQRGLDNLVRAAKPDGALMIWLYHPFGDFDRLRRRELLHTLWGDDKDDLAVGESLMRALKLDLDPGHYGPGRRSYDELEGNADAFMHPIVHAYRFGEAFDMFAKAGCDWAAIDHLNIQYLVKYLNLDEIEPPPAPASMTMASVRAAFDLPLSELLPDASLHDRFRKLDKRRQLEVVELAMRPRGFQVVAGRAGAEARFGKRLRGNLVQLR